MLILNWLLNFYYEANKDSGTDATPETGDTKQDTPAVPLGKDGKPFDPVRSEALIEKLRDENKRVKAQLKALTADEADPTDKPADKSKGPDKPVDPNQAIVDQLAKLNERLDKAETETKAAKLGELRQTVANEFKLPANLAKRLQGETLEELRADAAEMTKDLPPVQGRPKGMIGNGGETAPVSRAQKLFDISSGKNSVNPFDAGLQTQQGGYTSAANDKAELNS